MKEAEVVAKDASKTLADTLEEKKFGVGSTLDLETKAVLNYSNLTDNNVFAQVEGGVTYLPYVAPKVVNLFRRIPMSTETYAYTDQTAATRAAIMAALCGTGETFTSSETLEAKLINYVKVKDSLDICLDYASDYSFVEDSARFLLQTSVVDKIEDQLINGSGTSNEMFSLESYSAEFDDTFAALPLTDSIDSANMADLALGMAAQIEVSGLLNTYMPNVVLVNKGDFFKQIESAKDANGNYLDPRITKVGGSTYIGNLLVVASPKVAVNSMYVFDSTKGSILDRQQTTLAMSTENGTNFVDGFGTLLTVSKLQFLVRDAEAGAFMKCSNIATAISNILKPVV